MKVSPHKSRLVTINAFIVALIALFLSCSRQDAGKDLLTDNALKFRASLTTSDEGATRVWHKRDQVGVYAFSAGTLSDENVPYVTSDGDGYFLSKTPIVLTSDSRKDIVTYFPYQSDLSGEGLAMDYSHQAGGAAPDFFYGKRNGLVPFGAHIPSITLDRVNALLLVIVKGSEGFNRMRDLGVSIDGMPLCAMLDLSTGDLYDDGSRGTAVPTISGSSFQAAVLAVVPPGIDYGELKFTFIYAGKQVTWNPSPLQAKRGRLATYQLTLSGTGSGLHITENRAPAPGEEVVPIGPIVLTPNGIVDHGTVEPGGDVPIDPSTPGIDEPTEEGGGSTPDNPDGGDTPIDPNAPGIDPVDPENPDTPDNPNDGGVPIDPNAPGIDPVDPENPDTPDNPDNGGIPIDPNAPGIDPVDPVDPENGGGVPIDPNAPGIDPIDPEEGGPVTPDPNDPLGNVRPGVRAAYREEAVAKDPTLLKDAHFVRHMAPDRYFADGGSGERRNYSILFDGKKHSPLYVAYPMYSNVLGNAKRTNAWDYDPDLSRSIQPNLSKSYQSGGRWSRGHMLSSSSRTASRELNKTTFYFTNMLPQNQSQNGAQWNVLEGKERTWAQQHSICDTLYVACGPVYAETPSYTTDLEGKRIPIPEATFKVFLRKDKRDGNWHSIGFIMPNRDLGSTQYSDYAVPVTEVELRTGLQFFTHLDKGDAAAIKSQNDQSHWR